MNNPSNYVGQSWRLDGKIVEAIGATVCGKVLCQFSDGSTDLVTPDRLTDVESGQRVIYRDLPEFRNPNNNPFKL